jgi:hypothetical protein
MVRSWSCNVVKQQLSEEQFEWNFFGSVFLRGKTSEGKFFYENISTEKVPIEKNPLEHCKIF